MIFSTILHSLSVILQLVEKIEALLFMYVRSSMVNIEVYRNLKAQTWNKTITTETNKQKNNLAHYISFTLLHFVPIFFRSML